MGKQYLLYGHGGSYNHGAEAITCSTIAWLRSMSPESKITLSTHFAEQDREFSVPADEFVERNKTGKTNREIYLPTIERITSNSVCIHVGGDNYCYDNWQRWAEIHQAALERGAYSILWSCSVDPEKISPEMLTVLKAHHLITARESLTYRALIERGCTNVIKVRDIAFGLNPIPYDFPLKNYVVVNLSPLTIRKQPAILDAFQKFVDYILQDTAYNIALLPHVVQAADNDCEALRLLNTRNSTRAVMVPDNLAAAQLKSIISQARYCVSTRTHAAIAAYSSGIPTLAVSYSAKAAGIAEDLGMSKYVVDIRRISSGNEIIEKFMVLQEDCFI